MREIAAAALDAIPSDRPLRVELEGIAVALARVGDAVYAVGDVCAHRGAPLSEGKLSGARVACPWHGWMYDVRTGLCTFPVRGGRAQLPGAGRGRPRMGGAAVITVKRLTLEDAKIILQASEGRARSSAWRDHLRRRRRRPSAGAGPHDGWTHHRPEIAIAKAFTRPGTPGDAPLQRAAGGPALPGNEAFGIQ